MDEIRVHRRLTHLLNEEGLDNDCNTPDFEVASFLIGCFKSYKTSMERRDNMRKSAQTKPHTLASKLNESETE